MERRQSGWARGRGWVEGAEPRPWVVPTGKGWGQTKGGVVWVKRWSLQWNY